VALPVPQGSTLLDVADEAGIYIDNACRSGTCGACRVKLLPAGISNSELARRMHLDKKEARRILDPHHPTKLPRIEEALCVLGRQVQLALA
jgi:ferredoxin